MAKKAAKKAAKKSLKAAVNDLLGETPAQSRPPAKRATKKRAAKVQIEVGKEREVPMDGSVPEGFFRLRGKIIPAYPAMLANPEDGMKSAEVKAWYRDHHPELFNHIYPVVIVG